MFGDDSPEIRVAEASHRSRINSLRRMHELWTSSDEIDRSAIGEVELGKPMPLEGGGDPTT